MAYYRAGNCKQAVKALGKAMVLQNGGDANHWFFLAMAHWQLGDKAQARHWYGRAVAWMDKNKPHDDELRRFRAEAAGLLGVNESAATKGNEALARDRPGAARGQAGS